MQTRIQEKLMVVRLNCSFSFGKVTDKILTTKTQNEHNTKALLVKKELLPGDSGKHLHSLQSLLAKFYQYHIKYTMSSVNDGERLLPVPFYFDYMFEYEKQKQEVNAAFKVFRNDYNRACVQAQGLLNGAYNAMDYPDLADLDNLLHFRVKLLPLPQADTLLQAVGDCIQADVDSYLVEAVQASMGDLAGRIKHALSRMVRQLSDPKKKVYDSMTESLSELVGLVPSLNVTEDETVNAIIEQIRAKLIPVGPEELRTDLAKRQDTANEAQRILAMLG